jgi:hypothetical protein
MTEWLIIALMAAALVVFWSHRHNRMLGGLPAGDLVSADNEEQECPVLISHRCGLKGKPDALVRRKNGAMIPIERNRTRAPKRPYDGDLIQGKVRLHLAEDTVEPVDAGYRSSLSVGPRNCHYVPFRAWPAAPSVMLRPMEQLAFVSFWMLATSQSGSAYSAINRATWRTPQTA